MSNLLNNSSQTKKQEKIPKRYKLYDQINVNEKYLDYFIIGMVLLLIGLVILGVM